VVNHIFMTVWIEHPACMFPIVPLLLKETHIVMPGTVISAPAYVSLNLDGKG